MKYLLPLLLILFMNCKKNSISESEKKPIGEIFFYNDEVIMYEKPEASPILKKFQRTDTVKILETKIADSKNSQSKYYKVYYENQFGYIPIISEIKKNMFAFLNSNAKAKIKASSLRIRETPDLNGKVISAVPKGEIVDILSEGQLFEKVDLKYDTWMKIKTKDGKIGFSYAGYMTKNLNEIENYFSINSAPIEGYLQIKVLDPIYLSDTGTEVNNDSPGPCGMISLSSLPKQEDVVAVKEISSVKDEKFYLVEHSNDDHGCYDGYRGWISEKQVEFFEDIYKYTSEKYGAKFNKKLLEAINQTNNGKLNVKTLTINEFPFKVKEKLKFFQTNKFEIFYLKNSEYYYAGKSWASIEDIDKDGNDELVERFGECSCGCGYATILIWNGTDLKEIFRKTAPEYGETVSLDFQDKLVIENLTQYVGDPYSSDPNRKEKITTNYYEIKNFELVPTKKRPR